MVVQRKPVEKNPLWSTPRTIWDINEAASVNSERLLLEAAERQQQRQVKRRWNILARGLTYVETLGIILLLGFMLTHVGCAWQRQRMEAHYWGAAQEVIETFVKQDPALYACYKTSGTQPATYFVPVLDGVRGTYNKNMRHVTVSGAFYEKPGVVYKDQDVLVHEYVHYLNDINQPSVVCYDEMVAAMAQYIYDIETRLKNKNVDIKNLKRIIRRQGGR